MVHLREQAISQARELEDEEENENSALTVASTSINMTHRPPNMSKEVLLDQAKMRLVTAKRALDALSKNLEQSMHELYAAQRDLDRAEEQHRLAKEALADWERSELAL